MVKSQDTVLKQAIADFREEYGFSLEALIAALNEAGISHYSAGLGAKRVTFDIFPAAGYVTEFLKLLELTRPHRSRMSHGFKDASSNGDYNPAQDFIQYLRRWTLFAEQVMQREGENTRGVAAARAKLIMADLLTRFIPKPVKRGSAEADVITIFHLMQAIGIKLESTQPIEKTAKEEATKELRERNYLKALAKAQGMSIEDVRHHAA